MKITTIIFNLCRVLRVIRGCLVASQEIFGGNLFLRCCFARNNHRNLNGFIRMSFLVASQEIFWGNLI